MNPLHPRILCLPGEIIWDEKWPKSEKFNAAIHRLRNLGVSIRPGPGEAGVSIELRISQQSLNKYTDLELAEVGYLMAQLGNTVYPGDFEPKRREEKGGNVRVFSKHSDYCRTEATSEYLVFIVKLK